MTYHHIAGFYDLLDLPFEYGRYQRIRPILFDGLSGTVLDAGVGTGRNMPFYPGGAEVVGIDLSPAMLARARRRRDRLGLDVTLEEMDVLHTCFPGHSFDAVAATFLFCVLAPEQQAPALRELARICKPGGRIRILEYVYSEQPFRRLIMRLWAPDHAALGALGALGLWRRLRPGDRGLSGRGRARGRRDPLRLQGHHQADRRPARLTAAPHLWFKGTLG